MRVHDVHAAGDHGKGVGRPAERGGQSAVPSGAGAHEGASAVSAAMTIAPHLPLD